MAKNPIRRDSFDFLRQLAANNNREWFTANKQRYIDEVRDPLLEFIADCGPLLAKISKYIVADPRPVGGSLFRIYRDTRFSKDKSPYKTAAAMSFHHAGGTDEAPSPGFYLHLEPGRVFMGAGLWRPPAETLKQIRDSIVAKPKRWQSVRRSRGCAPDEPYEDGKLKRPPQGYDPEHPFIEDLKYKSFISSVTYTQAEACTPTFPTRFIAACRQKAPLMEFLAQAVGQRW